MLARRVHMICTSHIRIVTFRWRIPNWSWLHSSHQIVFGSFAKHFVSDSGNGLKNPFSLRNLCLLLRTPAWYVIGGGYIVWLGMVEIQELDEHRVVGVRGIIVEIVRLFFSHFSFLWLEKFFLVGPPALFDDCSNNFYEYLIFIVLRLSSILSPIWIKLANDAQLDQWACYSMSETMCLWKWLCFLFRSEPGELRK